MGRHKKWKTVKELELLIDSYFDKMSAEGRPLTITGLAVGLECDRDTLLNYEKDEKFFGTIKRAKDIIHNYAEEYLFTGKNVAGCIFNMKNNWGWKDKTELEQSGDVTITQKSVIESI